MTILTIILGLLPGFAWLFFYLQEDVRPEPKRLVALVFAVGAVSAFVALVVQLLINRALPHRFANYSVSMLYHDESTRIFFFVLLVFALVEEIAKFGAAYFVVHKSKYFSEPVEAMVYTAVAALGFATVENLAALGGSGRATLLSAVFEVASFRFVGTTLLHTLTSSLVGYYWALSIRRFGDKKLIVYGIVLATALHVIFNYLILVYNNLFYPIIFVAIIGFFTLADFEKLREEKV